MGRQQSRRFTVTLSNGETLSIIAVNSQKAIARATKWGTTREGSPRPVSIQEVK